MLYELFFFLILPRSIHFAISINLLRSSTFFNGSMSWYKPITNTTWVRAWLCQLQKECTRLASDQVYQLLAHRRWLSLGITASSTTKTGRHDIAEILLKVALKHQEIKSQIKDGMVLI